MTQLFLILYLRMVKEETLIGKRILNKSSVFTVFYKDSMSEKVRIEVIGE